jgi:predicted neuraminidase
MVDTPGFPDCNTCLRVDQQGQLHLYWPLVLANSWESCLTQYRIAANPKGTGAPDWTAAGQILLKPADFQEPLLQHLDELLVKLPRPLTPREEQELAELRSRAGEKLYQRLGWQPRCKPTVLKTGRVLLPLYSDTYSISIMAISDDNGATWRASQPLLGLGAIQPAVLERRDGTLVAYMRENGFTGRVRVCESTDGGETWGPVGLSELLNPGSGLDGVVLDSGHWLLVYNDLPQGRNSLAVSLSTDEGRSWQFTRHLERADAGSFHYPTVIQGADGTIHCVYSYFVTGGKSMKHASFPEDWLRQAPASSK